MKPSTFTIKPMGSTLQKSEYETIARNIMAILQRTGDTFRELTWEEYKEERLKDGYFNEGERSYFDKVCYLANGDKESILRFSPSWREAYEQSK